MGNCADIADANEKFFNEIYSENYNIVYQKVKNMIYSKVDDDITGCVQDTFLTAWDKIDTLHSHPNITGWLIVTAQNVVSKFNAKYLNRQKLTDDSIDMEDIVQENDFTQELIDDMEYQKYIESGIVEKFISQLSESERQLYELKYKQKLKNEDIAKILKITSNAVASRSKRLIQKFKKNYLSAGDEK